MNYYYYYYCLDLLEQCLDRAYFNDKLMQVIEINDPFSNNLHVKKNIVDKGLSTLKGQTDNQ